MGTLFSFVDKIISSFAPMIASIVFAAIGFTDRNPTMPEDNVPELKYAIAFLAFGMIIIGLICNIIAMKFYPLTKEKMEEIQEKVAAIKAASK
jgi:Na+/melibiose symporter-like transporter